MGDVPPCNRYPFPSITSSSGMSFSPRVAARNVVIAFYTNIRTTLRNSPYGSHRNLLLHHAKRPRLLLWILAVRRVIIDRDISELTKTTY